MAGKSTMLRMTCSVALLGACGLFAPAASATVPYIDAFMLRNLSADSPLENKSSFFVEMTEMRCAEDAGGSHELRSDCGDMCPSPPASTTCAQIIS